MRSGYCLSLLVVLFSLVCTTPSFASVKEGEGDIKGRVVRQTNHQPISDAKVEIIEGNKSLANTQTDKQGGFVLEIPKLRGIRRHFIIRISHVGYETYIKRVDQEVKALELEEIVLKESTQNLEEVVVTSTRTLRHHKDVPVPTQIITRAQIDRIAPTTMKDILLYSIPGIEFSQHGGITHITMQGYNADYIAFLIDGEEVAGLKSGSIDLSRLSPDNIERIEVIKGAGSALYGSSAIAGVINIITRQYNKPFSAGASVGYSQTGGWTSHLQTGVKTKIINNSLTGSFDREGGYTLETKNKSVSLDVPRNDIFRIGNRLKVTPSDQIAFGWDANFSRRKQFRNEFHNDIYDYLTNTLRASWQLSPTYRISALYNGDYSSRVRDFFKAEEKETQHKNFVQTLRLQHDVHFGNGNDLNFGIEGHMESMLSSQINEAKEKKSIKYGVLFAQHLWKIGSSVDLLYGARADYHSNYGLHLSPKATLSYKMGGWILRGGYSRAFKSPSVMDLYFNWSHQGMFDIIGNPDLKPETANQFLTNLEWSNALLSFAAGVTHTLFKDRIVMQQDKKGNQHHVNIDGTSRMTVADAHASWRICNGFTLSGSYTFSHAPAYREINGSQVDLSTIRPHNLLAKFDAYKAWDDKWSTSLALIGQYLSTIKVNTVSKEEGTDKLKVESQVYEGYPMFRTTASVSYDRRITLSLSVDNLLGYKANNLGYQNASLTPGRIFYGKLSFQL